MYVAHMIHMVHGVLARKCACFYGTPWGSTLDVGRRRICEKLPEFITSVIALPHDVLPISCRSMMTSVTRTDDQDPYVSARAAVNTRFAFHVYVSSFPTNELSSHESFSFSFFMMARLESCVIARGGFEKIKP